MQQVQSKEIKYLIIFLLTLILTAAAIWTALEFATPKAAGKPEPGNKPVKNLAAEQEEEVEKVPIAGENFETYQFRDPFMPLSKTAAPAENVAPGSPTGSAADAGNGSNTAAGSITGIRVIEVKTAGNKAQATVNINGRQVIVAKGQNVDGYKIINIDTASAVVEFLQGDQKFTISSGKG